MSGKQEKQGTGPTENKGGAAPSENKATTNAASAGRAPPRRLDCTCRIKFITSRFLLSMRRT